MRPSTSAVRQARVVEGALDGLELQRERGAVGELALLGGVDADDRRLPFGEWHFVSLLADDDQGVDGLGHLAVDADRVDVDRLHLGEFEGERSQGDHRGRDEPCLLVG